MRNDQIRVLDLAKELGVHAADVQHGLQVMKLPERQSILGFISGQHAEGLRTGLRNGAWRRRSPDVKVAARPKPPTLRTYFPLCDCCDLKFPVTLPAGEIRSARGVCPACAEHPSQAGESETRRIARLEDHLGRTRSWTTALERKLDDMEVAKEQAYHTRNVWRETLVRVILAHALDEGSGGAVCTCGEAYPCTTRRVLVSTNRGINSNIEEFEAMPERKRDKLLAGEPWTASDEIDYQLALDRDDHETDHLSAG